MKKLISICLVLCMLLGMVSAFPVSAALTWPGAYNGLGAEYKNGYVSTVGDYVAAFRKSGADGTAEAGVDYQATSSDPWGADGAFVQVVGDWAYLEVDMPYTGVYVMQMHNAWLASSSAVYHVTTDEGYAAEFNITNTGWSSGCGQDQPIYLKSGLNVIKVALVGGGNAIIDGLDFGAMNATSAEKSLDYLPNVKLADDLVVPTPAPTPTPKPVYPEGWDGVVENHPDYNADAEALYIDAFMPNMSSDEGMEQFGTDWSYSDETGSVPNKGQEDGIYFTPGTTATYTLTVAESGVYAAQIKVGNGNGTTAHMELKNTVGGVEYIARYAIPNIGSWGGLWTNDANIMKDDLIYLQAGANEITLTNVGETGGVVYYDSDYGLLNNTDFYMTYVGTTEDPDNTWPEGWTGNVRNCADWTGSYTSAYGGNNLALDYDSLYIPIPYTENGIALDGVWVNYTVTAPAAGMYLVTAEAAEASGELTLTNQNGDYVIFDLADATPEYIWLDEGDNTITATGSAEFVSATFYQLNNSDDYLSQNKNVNDVPEVATDLTIKPYSDRTNDSGFYRWSSSYEAVVQYSGSSMTYDVNCAFPGIYRVQAKIGGTTGPSYPVITIDTDADEGYRAKLATSYVDDWGTWRSTDENGAYQYVYLKEGVNKVVVTAGGTHHVLWSVEFKLLSAEEEASITMDDLTKTPPSDLVINPYTDSIVETENVDYHMINGRNPDNKPALGSSIGTQLMSGEWQRFEVTAKVAGYYRVATTAATYDAEATIAVETDNTIASVKHVTSPDNYRTFEGDVVYLDEGVNSIWVQNLGGGWVYLQRITLSYVDDMTDVTIRTFVQGHNFIGASANPAEITKYTVRNNYYGLHMGDTSNTGADTEVLSYNVTIPADDYYGLVMTATMPLTPTMKVTMNNGTDDIVIFEGEPAYFGNENEANSLTLNADKVYLAAGDYTMTVSYTENPDAGSDSMMMAHVHGYEFTTLTRQDMFLAAMQAAGTTDDIADALAEFEDIIKSEISLTPETDFIYPEYAYNALLNCAMLESGSYETYDDVKTAYDFAKNMIAVADDGTGSLVYTVQVGDWNAQDTMVLVAVYAGEQLYMMGEGYLNYTEATGTYIPVEATLYDYVPEDGDTIKVFIWDSFDGLRPVF